MFTYRRKVAYHETDKMGITHHSNYVKFLEEARVGYLENAGTPFQEFESRGIVSPVVSISLDYKSPSTFADELLIKVWVTKYTGIKLEVAYEVSKAHDGTLVATGCSRHAFLFNDHVVSLRKVAPDLHEKFLEKTQAEGAISSRVKNSKASVV